MLDYSQHHFFDLAVQQIFVVIPQFVSAASEEKRCHEQRGSLVSVDKAVIGCKRMEKGRRFLRDETIVTGIRARDRRFDRTNVPHPRTAAKRKRMIVRQKNFLERYAVMPAYLSARRLSAFLKVVEVRSMTTREA